MNAAAVAPLSNPDYEVPDVIAEMPNAMLDRFRAASLGRDALSDLPRPEWRVAGLLPDRGVAVLWGSPGAMKTFLSLGWACALASSQATWEGHALKPSPVLYVAGEGAHGLGQRVDAWEALNDARVPDERLCVLPEAVQLLRPTQVNALIGLACEIGAAFVVVDTFARCLVGGEENSARDVGVAVDALGEIARAIDGTVLVVHHGDKAGSAMRGSSALKGAADAVLELANDGTIATLKVEKQKDAAAGDPVYLRSIPRCGSLALGVSDGSETSDRLRDGESQLVSLFREHVETSGIAPTALEKLAEDVLSMPRATLYRHRKTLVARGVLRNVGTEQRPRYTLSSDPMLEGVTA